MPVIHDFTIPCRGFEMEAALTLPDGFDPEGGSVIPFVVQSHGFGGGKFHYEDLSLYLAERGTGSLRYTFLGGGPEDTSGFGTKNMSVMTEVQDLNRALDYALSLPYVRRESLFLFGESQGGLVTALTAPDRAGDFQGIMLLYPAMCISDDWVRMYPDPDQMPEEVVFNGVLLGRAYRKDLPDEDLVARASAYEGPVLLMHGREDTVVPFGYSVRLGRVYKDVSLTLFEGEGHGFSEEGEVRMRALVHAFMQDHLAGK